MTPPQWLAPNASEYPTITHSKLITPIATKDWTIVAITFFPAAPVVYPISAPGKSA